MSVLCEGKFMVTKTYDWQNIDVKGVRLKWALDKLCKLCSIIVEYSTEKFSKKTKNLLNFLQKNAMRSLKVCIYICRPRWWKRVEQYPIWFLPSNSMKSFLSHWPGSQRYDGPFHSLKILHTCASLQNVLYVSLIKRLYCILWHVTFTFFDDSIIRPET